MIRFAQTKHQWIIATGFIFFLLLPVTVAAKDVGFQKAEGFLGKAVEPTGIKEGNVNIYVARIIQAGLILVGLAFFVLMVYGGFLWMTARGNEDQITRAKNVIIAATIGITVIVAAAAITNLVVKSAIKVGQQTIES